MSIATFMVSSFEVCRTLVVRGVWFPDSPKPETLNRTVMSGKLPDGSRSRASDLLACVSP